jgi:hypothetical protein
MRLLPLMMLVLPLQAATIGDSSATLLPGDSLAFQILTWNFGFNAARYGLDPYPSDVSFTFATAASGAPARVTALLESPDGSTVVTFDGPLDFTPGFFAGSQYRGAVSTLRGFLQLSPELSADIFRTGSARLILRNDGTDLQLGLPPNTLRQDLAATLSGGPLSVGAPASAITVQTAVPEPAMLLPVIIGLVLIVLARLPKNQPFANRQSTLILSKCRLESFRLQSANPSTEFTNQPE